jgi:hypothetical protein
MSGDGVLMKRSRC